MMLIAKCDNHPDRDAVATFRVIELPPGSRPILIGYTAGPHKLIDLCEKCAKKLRTTIKEKNAT